MYTCIRRSFILTEKIFTCSRNSSSKPYSSLSPKQYKFNGCYDKNKLFLSKISTPKQTQNRNFSLENVNSFFESIRTSEAAQFFTSLMVKTHDLTGFSWTVTIISATLIVKLLISLPCGIYQQYLAAKIDLTKVELNKSAQKIKNEVLRRGAKSLWTEEKLNYEFRKEMGKLWSALIVKNNCHPFKIIILFFAQLPFWLLFTVTIKTIADSNTIGKESVVSAVQFLVGGPFWCRNLSLPDPTYILPTINTLSMLAIAEVALSSKIREKVTQNFRGFLANKLVPNFLRLFAVAFFFISAASPAGVSLFWAASSLTSLGQNLLYLSPKARRFFKIPKTNSELEKPYRHLCNDIVARFTKIFNRKK